MKQNKKLMKKHIIYLLSATLLLASCGTLNQTGAVLTGASLGGNMGSAIGGLVGDSRHGWRGEYRGSAIGTIIGTLAGAAIGGAVSSARQQEHEAYPIERNESYQPVERNTVENDYSNIGDLRIHRIRFIDADKNHVISSEETCQVLFEIINEGEETAYNVVPIVTTDNKKLSVSQSVLIEQIAPHQGIKYTATIKAGKRLKQGETTIHLGIADRNGLEYDKQEFKLPVQR